MEQRIVECNECHYEFNYTFSQEESIPADFPKIVRCPECGIGSNIENTPGNIQAKIVPHGQHTGSKTGVKIWLTMLGPIILLEIMAFLSMPLLRLNFFFYLSGMVIVAISAWTITAVSSFLISRYLSSARIVLEEPLE